MREGSQQDAKEMVIWGTPAVQTDRFSVALPAPEMPDLLGLACVGSAWGVGARSMPACRKEPWEGVGSVTLALASVAAWLVPFLLPAAMAGHSCSQQRHRLRSSSHAPELWVIGITLISVC